MLKDKISTILAMAEFRPFNEKKDGDTWSGLQKKDYAFAWVGQYNEYGILMTEDMISVITEDLEEYDFDITQLG